MPGHTATELIVEECHHQVFHSGVAQTLTQLRSKFWICRGRQDVRKVLHSCCLCGLIEGQLYSGPQSPPLSAFRTTIGRPFDHTGVDFARPFYVKCDQNHRECLFGTVHVCSDEESTWILFETSRMTCSYTVSDGSRLVEVCMQL